MNGKKNALIVTAFILALFIIIGLIGISSHIPFFKGVLSLIFAIILILFVIVFFVIIIRRKR